MDLSKAFDTINHQLLIAKLHAYGVDKDSLTIILNYLSDRWQRTKIDTSFSSWSGLIQGVPQGSVLGPLLFNIYINDLFFVLNETEICNFADDTTPYACDKSLENVISRLERDSLEAIIWFENNYMKLNTEKCHLLIAGKKTEHIWAKVGESKIWEEHKVKLLGVTIDNELKFDEHVSNICLKAGRKLSTLTRMVKFLSFEKRRILLKAFIESQFKYCTLAWMFHSRESNNKINRLHERTLRIVYNDYLSSFDELLEKDGFYSVHHSNIQTLAIEMYKVLHDSSQTLTSNLFKIKTYNGPSLRTINPFSQPQVRTVLNGQNSLRYMGPVIWNLVPNDIKNVESLEEFKKLIRKWKCLYCPCRLCRAYIAKVGFVTLFE